MEENKSPVYAFIRADGAILRVEGGYSIGNITDLSEWTKIDEGVGSKYDRAQIEYFPDGMYTEDRIPLYKWDGSKTVARTAEEIETERASLPVNTDPDDDRDYMLIDLTYRVTLLELGLTE